MTLSSDRDDRRHAVIIINAATGDHRAARGLASRAIRKVLGVRRWREDPHVVTYDPSFKSGYEEHDARYSLYVNDDEMAALLHELHGRSEAEGWSRPPFDTYHD